MKLKWFSRHLFVLGFVILIVTNIIVLSGVAANRSGTPTATVTLTERELKIPYRLHEENSGLALQLVWRTLGKEVGEIYYYDSGSPAWFNAEKLESLGFKLPKHGDWESRPDHYKRSIAKEVFIVLENDGLVYREFLNLVVAALQKKKAELLKMNTEEAREKLKRLEDRLARERTSESRLFAVDAGLDPTALRRRYPDTTRFVITRGQVVPMRDHDGAREHMAGNIRNLSMDRIHMPREQRKALDAILDQEETSRRQPHAPRYTVALAYGSRWEPWVLSVHETADGSD